MTSREAGTVLAAQAPLSLGVGIRVGEGVCSEGIGIMSVWMTLGLYRE